MTTPTLHRTRVRRAVVASSIIALAVLLARCATAGPEASTRARAVRSAQVVGVSLEIDAPDPSITLPPPSTTSAPNRSPLIIPISAEAAFELGSATIIPSRVKDLVAALRPVMRSTSDIHVVGHASASGSAHMNLALSIARSERIKELLVTMGVDPDRIMTAGVGETELRPELDPEDPGQRRVEVSTVVVS